MSDELQRDEILSAGPDDGDWAEVVRRALRARRRQGIYGVVLLTALVAVGVASAYALGHPVVDFGSAEKGPMKVVNDFGSLEVGAPAGMAPGVLPHQTRRIESFRIDGKEHVLWVAPTKQGGFCATWSRLGGGCRANRHDRFAKEIDVQGSGRSIPRASKVFLRSSAALFGSFFYDAAARVEVSYADGSAAEAPFVWVTAPIDAGFFHFQVPGTHRLPGHWPIAVTLRDEEGHSLARANIDNSIPRFIPDLVPRHVPGFGELFVPNRAIWEERRQLFDVRADDGARLGLWIAPERGGGTCIWWNQSGSCTNINEPDRKNLATPRRPPELLVNFFGGGSHVTLFGGVGRRVDSVEARFQDGDRIELEPKEGYLLWPIPSRHFALGHRVRELIAFDASGRAIARQRMRTNARGTYPCAKPKNYGYRTFMCP
jgi:hypothetical protein